METHKGALEGRIQCIVVVVAEPLPTRIVAAASPRQDQAEMLETPVEGKRLRDITDLPFDLAL